MHYKHIAIIFRKSLKSFDMPVNTILGRNADSPFVMSESNYFSAWDGEIKNASFSEHDKILIVPWEWRNNLNQE